MKGQVVEHCSSELQALLCREVEFIDDEFGIKVLLSVHEMYTSRACDELAVALCELVEGSSIIQVKTAGEWPGGLLLHAGVQRDDVVYDIEGAHDVDEWIDRWGRGMDIEVHRFDPSVGQNTFQNETSRKLAIETADLLLDVPELYVARKSLPQM